MTSREMTGLLTLRDEAADRAGREDLQAWAWRIGFGAIGWPWLARSLHGGSQAEKQALLRRLEMPADALPHLGSWKADTAFLHHIVDQVRDLRPRTVVELGAGASSLVCARALQLHGGGRLISFDQHAGFVDATRQWLSDHGLAADMRHAPLVTGASDWPGRWYAVDALPESIDLIIIDGPPWTVHPYVRGGAEKLFGRLAPGGVVLLDDAARPGERIVARRWRKAWPDITFTLIKDGAKGTLIGRRKGVRTDRAREVPPLAAANDTDEIARAAQPRGAARHFARAAMIAALVGAGWMAHDQIETVSPSAYASSDFVEEAATSHKTSLIRGPMRSQLESADLDPGEIERFTHIRLPTLPPAWHVTDVQLYPAGKQMSVQVMLRTAAGEPLSLFAMRAETPAGRSPVLAQRSGTNIAYWEDGDLAYALTGSVASGDLLKLAASVARAGD